MKFFSKTKDLLKAKGIDYEKLLSDKSIFSSGFDYKKALNKKDFDVFMKSEDKLKL